MKKVFNKRIFHIVILLLWLSNSLTAQNIHYQETFYGGITGAGFSVGQSIGGGSFNVYMPSGSIIKKALLYSYRIGKNAFDYNINLNGIDYTFGEYNRISRINNNNGIINAPDFSVHCIDITNDIDSSISNYMVNFPSFTIPYLGCNDCRYNSVFLAILYENPALSKTNVALIFNNKDNDTTVTYNITNLNPINNANNVSLSVYSDRLFDFSIISDYGSNLYINSDTVGILGGADSVNYIYDYGVKGHFYYQDSNLYGLDDDTPDSIMYRSDGLADIKSYLNYGETSMLLITDYQSHTNANLYSDFFLTFHLAYTTPCDTFTAGLSCNDTLICFGDSVQLFAYGGIKYKWKPAIGLSCDTCANPFAKPDSSTLYTCAIYNTDSCSKVLPVKVNVRPSVSFNTTTIPTTCGLQDGSLTINNIVNAQAPVTYILNGMPQSANTFTGLDTGVYFFYLTDGNGCTSSPVPIVLNDTNYVTANFSSSPITGVNPLDVNFTYTGNNGTDFIWSFGTSDSAFINNPNYIFNNAGSFLVTLIAWANDSVCSDTATAILLVNPALVIPQFISPNNDGQNDTWIIQGLLLYPNAGVAVYNRWGNLVYSSEPYQNNWGGQCLEPTCLGSGAILPTGTYFYYLFIYGKANTDTKDFRSGYLELQP